MNKPSKKQLVDAVIHYETEIKNLLDTHNQGTSVDFAACLAEVLVNAPSLEPQPKAVVEVPVVEESSVDPEAPAVA